MKKNLFLGLAVVIVLCIALTTSSFSDYPPEVLAIADLPEAQADQQIREPEAAPIPEGTNSTPRTSPPESGEIRMGVISEEVMDCGRDQAESEESFVNGASAEPIPEAEIPVPKDNPVEEPLETMSDLLPKGGEEELETPTPVGELKGGAVVIQDGAESQEKSREKDSIQIEEIVNEERYKIPPELEDGYQAVTGEKEEDTIQMHQLGQEEGTEVPPFQVTLPGQSQVPIAPYNPYEQEDMPDTLLNGEAPLYKGCKILRNEIFGKNHSIEIEVPTTCEKAFHYYKTVMTEKGWSKGMSMINKERGMLFFTRGDQELVFRLEKHGKNTRITINMVGKERFNAHQKRHYLP